MKKSLLFLLLIVSISVNSQEWKQNEDLTKVTFKIKNFGVNVDGNFSDIKIETNFNSGNLTESYINASIVVKSISTGIESRDEHLLKEDYFDESNHSLIKLKSTKIEKKESNQYTLFADLTIKGITKEVKISLFVPDTNIGLALSGNFTINRKDFKVGGGSFIMSKNVKIQVAYSGTK